MHRRANRSSDADADDTALVISQSVSQQQQTQQLITKGALKISTKFFKEGRRSEP
jgi:hypothetical protein